MKKFLKTVAQSVINANVSITNTLDYTLLQRLIEQLSKQTNSKVQMQKISNFTTLKQIPAPHPILQIENQQYNLLLNKIRTLRTLDVRIRYINQPKMKRIVEEKIQHHTLFQQLIKKKIDNQSQIYDNNDQEILNISIDSVSSGMPSVNSRQKSHSAMIKKKSVFCGKKSDILHLSIQNQRLKFEERILKEKIQCEKLLKLKIKQTNNQSKKNLLKLKEMVVEQMKVQKEIQEIHQDYEYQGKKFNEQTKTQNRKIKNLTELLESSSHLPQDQIIAKLRKLIEDQL